MENTMELYNGRDEVRAASRGRRLPGLEKDGSGRLADVLCCEEDYEKGDKGIWYYRDDLVPNLTCAVCGEKIGERDLTRMLDNDVYEVHRILPEVRRAYFRHVRCRPEGGKVYPTVKDLLLRDWRAHTVISERP